MSFEGHKENLTKIKVKDWAFHIVGPNYQLFYTHFFPLKKKASLKATSLVKIVDFMRSYIGLQMSLTMSPILKL